MTNMNKFTAISLVLCLQSTRGFAPSNKASHPSPFHRAVKTTGGSSCLRYKEIRPFSDQETEDMRKQRMEMVNKLRRAFYSDEHTKEDHSKLTDNTRPKVAYGSSIISNLPALSPEDLYDITSNEMPAVLPGYQYVWNIHSPEHCHMFHSILAKEGPWFFACLSEQSIFSDKPRFATLMKICDHRVRDEDGRIVLAVQSMDRLLVNKISSSYMTIRTGDFQIWPEVELVRENLATAFPSDEAFCNEIEADEQDSECITQTMDPKSVSQAALAASAAESYRCRNFEYAPIYLTEKPKGPDDAHSLHANPNDSKATQMIKAGIKKQQEEENKYEIDYLKVNELANYDAIAYRSLIDSSAVNAQAIKNYWTNTVSEQANFVDEEELFAKLVNDGDEPKTASFTVASQESGLSPLPDFSTFANAPSTEGVVMMEYHLWKSLDELIRLLNTASKSPVPLSSQLLALLPKRNDWPEGFVLDEYSKSMLSKTGPVVRIDDITKQSRSSVYDNTGYSSLRRALRLSHAVWLLLDGLAVTGVNPPPPSRAQVLAMESIFERLKVSKAVLDSVNEVLRNMIPHINKDGKEDSEN